MSDWKLLRRWQEFKDEIRRAPILEDCQHLQKEIRAKTIAGGAIQHVYQCLRCGEKIGNPVAQNAKRAPFNEELRESFRARVTAEIDGTKGYLSAKWFALYSQYLWSPEWAAKREMVLQRDDFICQGCGSARATQVHHLTYERVTQEMLFDLTSICDACHEICHDEPKGD